MGLFPQTTWLPMLRKELVERAARPRTYVVRWVYAIGFLSAFLMIYQGLMHSGNQNVSGLGLGDETFVDILGIQLIGILLFLPAMMCGLITDEKERGTLQLLTLTDISNKEAITQKFLGGLIPMLTLLLLTLPVGGFAYLLGGLTIEMVWVGSLRLVIVSSSIAAVSLACSSYARTTIEAFMGAYFILGLLYLFGPPLLHDLSNNGLNGKLLAFCFAHGVITAIALTAACRYYQTRAEVPPNHRLRRLFQALDNYFVKANQRCGGVELIKDRGNLPTTAPILWRERKRHQLGKARYQIRYLVAVAVLAVGTALVSLGSLNSMEAVTLLAWTIGSLIIVAQASNLIVAERLSQSLDTLLTTPLSGADIVAQKARSLLPLMLVVAVAIWTLTAMRVFSDWIIGDTLNVSIITLVHEIIHLLIFLPLFMVLGLAIGLGARTRVSAMMRAIGILVFWCAMPLSWLGIRSGHLSYLKPSGLITAHHAYPMFHLDQLVRYGLAICVYACITQGLFLWCRRNADRKLGRPA